MASSATHEAIASPSSPASRSLSFTDLPREVQSEIISHCSISDLICVALVSKHFRDLAAAELYRDFFIAFPDEDNPQFDTPVDALAGGFDTFVTSEYDYAQYLRTLCFDTLYLGDKAEVAYRPYLANLSCGKFMNTLLLLTLRKARALESFKYVFFSFQAVSGSPRLDGDTRGVSIVTHLCPGQTLTWNTLSGGTFASN
jgi:hypothetical protein